MAKEHLVMIGDGPAANEAAPILRQKAPQARITIIGRELIRYYRPDLLPRFIAGEVGEEDLYVNPLEFYKAHDIKLRLGQEVVGVDFSGRTLKLGHNELVRFDGLIIATGAKHRIPEPLEPFQNLMLTLKTVADAKIWIEKLRRVDSVLVIGCDLTSVSFTKAVLALGKEVTFFLDKSSPHMAGHPGHAGEKIAEKLTDAGANVVECPKVEALAKGADDLVEVTAEGARFRAGAVGAFFGMVPDVKFLLGSGLAIERGILVDEYLQTNFDGVYAAGDCAQVYHPALRDYWVSIGFNNAKQLGRTAALNLAGDKGPVDVDRAGIFHVEGAPINTSWWLEA